MLYIGRRVYEGSRFEFVATNVTQSELKSLNSTLSTNNYVHFNLVNITVITCSRVAVVAASIAGEFKPSIV